jgi:hypothetical protein
LFELRLKLGSNILCDLKEGNKRKPVFDEIIAENLISNLETKKCKYKEIVFF